MPIAGIVRQNPHLRHPRFHPDNRGFDLQDSGLGAAALASI
jgi:hypothetical protein